MTFYKYHSKLRKFPSVAVTKFQTFPILLAQLLRSTTRLKIKDEPPVLTYRIYYRFFCFFSINAPKVEDVFFCVVVVLFKFLKMPQIDSFKVYVLAYSDNNLSTMS